jgi:uncharacterized protein DUF6186
MNRAVTLWGYAALAVAGVAYQVVGVLFRRTATLGQFVSRVTNIRAGRFLLLAGWLWAGWHTFVRRG